MYPEGLEPHTHTNTNTHTHTHTHAHTHTHTHTHTQASQALFYLSVIFLAPYWLNFCPDLDGPGML